MHIVSRVELWNDQHREECYYRVPDSKACECCLLFHSWITSVWRSLGRRRPFLDLAYQNDTLSVGTICMASVFTVPTLNSNQNPSRSQHTESKLLSVKATLQRFILSPWLVRKALGYSWGTPLGVSMRVFPKRVNGRGRLTLVVHGTIS